MTIHGVAIIYLISLLFVLQTFAWCPGHATCLISNDCTACADHYCRVGDHRCLTDDDCAWANSVDHTNRDCTRLPVVTIGTNGLVTLTFSGLNAPLSKLLRDNLDRDFVDESEKRSCGYHIQVQRLAMVKFFFIFLLFLLPRLL